MRIEEYTALISAMEVPYVSYRIPGYLELSTFPEAILHWRCTDHEQNRHNRCLVGLADSRAPTSGKRAPASRYFPVAPPRADFSRFFSEMANSTVLSSAALP